MSMKRTRVLKLFFAFALSFQCIYTAEVTDIAAPANVIIDLSRWNENVNLTLAKEDGVRAVMLRATRGLTYVDPTYKERTTAAEEVGLLRGAYHFLEGSDGKLQAENFLKEVGEDVSVLLALDIEKNNGGNETMTAKHAEDFVNTIYARRRRYPLIYGSADFLKDFSTPLLQKCPLWIARWGESPTLPQGWNDWVMWQYTNGTTGPEPHSVNGIGPVDRSKFNGTLFELVKFWITGELKYKYIEILGAARLNGIVALQHWTHGKFDFKTAKEDGILAVTHRATGGLTITDSKYTKKREAALKAGLLWGAVHEYLWGADGTKQADYFLEAVGNESDTLLVVELSPWSQSTSDMTPPQDMVTRFISRIQAVTGRYPIVRGSYTMLKDMATHTLLQCPLWLQRDAESEFSLPKVPPGWSDWDLWEYRSTGSGPSLVKGLGLCSRSAFNGTPEQLISFWHGRQVATAPE